MRDKSSTTRGYSFCSLWLVSPRSGPRLRLELRDRPRGEIHRASTRVCTMVDLPLPGGPATMIPEMESNHPCNLSVMNKYLHT